MYLVNIVSCDPATRVCVGNVEQDHDWPDLSLWAILALFFIAAFYMGRTHALNEATDR